MRNWNTGGLSLSRPKQEQQNSVWQYLISGWKSNAYLRQVTETWPSSKWSCCFMGWDADFGRRCKHRYDQTRNIWCQAVYWNALESLNLKQVVTKQGRIQDFFFRRGCTPLLLYFNTNKPHFFFCRIPVILENRRSSRGGGWGAHPLHPPPRSAPAKATRTTKSSQTLVDHVITNLPRRVTHTDVLPCTLVSDHDASYVFF